MRLKLFGVLVGDGQDWFPRRPLPGDTHFVFGAHGSAVCAVQAKSALELAIHAAQAWRGPVVALQATIWIM